MGVSTVLAEIVGFLIVVFVVYRYVLPPLRTMTNKRAEAIEAQVEDARKARARLEAAELTYNQTVEDAENEASRIRDDARADAERIAQEMRQQAEEEVERIRRRGEEQLENNRLHAVRELRGELGGHAVTLASQLVRQELSSDEAKQSSVDSVIEEIERSATRDKV